MLIFETIQYIGLFDLHRVILRTKFAFFISWVVGISIFVCWMLLVGNPHVNETIIGLFISTIIGMWINHKIDPWDI